MVKKAIIVDDSLLIRKITKKILEEMSYKVVGEASNGIEAIRKAETSDADLMIIDVMMPKMDGLTALSKIMEENPVKTLVVSAYDSEQMDMACKALEIGALSFIQKNSNLKTFEKELKKQVRIAETAFLPRKKYETNYAGKKKVISKNHRVNKNNHLVILGASTGGPGVIHEVVSALKKPFPPIILIQHLPTGFTASFITRLQKKTDLSVLIAEDEIPVKDNTIYMAPGGKHLILKANGNSPPFFETYEGDKVNGVMPSLDPTILSASHIYKDQLTIAIFTGMGNDGLAGVRSAKRHNAFVFTQNKESCTIYGMPKAINDAGLADYTNTPKNIVTLLNQRLSKL